MPIYIASWCSVFVAGCFDCDALNPKVPNVPRSLVHFEDIRIKSGVFRNLLMRLSWSNLQCRSYNSDRSLACTFYCHWVESSNHDCVLQKWVFQSSQLDATQTIIQYYSSDILLQCLFVFSFFLFFFVYVTGAISTFVEHCCSILEENI